MTLLPTDLTIEDLLPHRGRMLLIDEVMHIEDDHAVAAVQVGDRWPLADRAAVSPLMIIEAVAQTAGLGNGLNLIKEQGKGADKTGWIVGIKKARFFTDALPLGARLVVESKNRFKFDDFVEIEGSARIDDTIVGEVILQVLKADPNPEPQQRQAVESMPTNPEKW